MRASLLYILVAGVACAQPAVDSQQESRWKSAYIPQHKLREVKVVADRIQCNWARYTNVGASTNVPPYVVAALHNMEASGSFLCHLHEGSSLRYRTRYVPIGRPKTGTPPFTWEYSAKDAMAYDDMGSKNWKRLGTTLSSCENYNGVGYRKYHPSTPTPYLWAKTSIEKPGKYVADGHWSPTARSEQVGVAAIFKELERRNAIKLP